MNSQSEDRKQHNTRRLDKVNLLTNINSSGIYRGDLEAEDDKDI